MSNRSDPATPTYIAGPVLGLLLAIFVSVLGMAAASHKLSNTETLVIVGIGAGGPLLLGQLGIWVYYLWRKPPPAWVHAAMWLPGLLAALVVPVILAF